jgi:osmoprotectant transport system permease protein
MILADNGLPGLDRVPIWLNDPANYWGPDGLVARVREHLLYTLVIVVVAILIALPIGLIIGHTGRGVVVVVGLANSFRAVPSFGLLILLSLLLTKHLPLNESPITSLIVRHALPYAIPALLTLVILAIPPILTGTYSGVQAVDPAARDAARGMGMTGGQVVRKVEFPVALPLILSGIRSATLQVIATLVIVAYLPFLGGLGYIINNGENDLTNLQFGYPAMVGAGVVVAVLAVLVDLLLALVQRYVVSRGVSGRFSRRVRAGSDVTTEAQLANA